MRRSGKIAQRDAPSLREPDVLIATPTRPTGRANPNTDDPDLTYTPPPLRSTALLLGTLIHRFLEHWDFSCEKCSMPASLTHLANSYFAQEGLLRRALPDPKKRGNSNSKKTTPWPNSSPFVDEAQRLLADFIGSEAEEEIKGSEILGREVPFFYATTLPPYHATTTLMRGTMDIPLSHKGRQTGRRRL